MVELAYDGDGDLDSCEIGDNVREDEKLNADSQFSEYLLDENTPGLLF